MSDLVKTFVKLNPKFYDMIRQAAIKSWVMGFVELVLNSIDAYRRNNIPKAVVYVTLDREKNTISVRDAANGMNAQTMKSKILEVGSENTDTSTLVRGMMGRGAKDISILGDTYFYSIKDGKFSACVIDHSMMAAMIAEDAEITDEIRTLYGIPLTGTKVEIHLNEFNSLTNISNERLLDDIRKDYLLRNILQDDSIEIRATVIGNSDPLEVKDLLIKYVPMPAKKIVDIKYEVPGYEGIDATFTLYKTTMPMPDPKSDRKLEYGILIYSDGAVYECSMLSPLFQTYSTRKMIRGGIHCNGIRKLMIEAILGNKSEKNPKIMLDPSRVEVLDRNHPFVKSLLTIPLQWLELTLNQVQDRNDEGQITSSDFDEINKHISDAFSSSLINDQTFQFMWRSKRDDELLQQMKNPLKSLEVDTNIIKMSDQMLNEIKNGNDFDRSSSFTGVGGQTPTTDPKFKIIYTNKPQDSSKYYITTYNNSLTLSINVGHAALRGFIEVNEGGLEFINRGKGTYSIAPVVIEAFKSLIMRDYLLKNADYFTKATYASDVFNLYNDLGQQIETSISGSIYKTFYDLIQNFSNQKLNQ